MKWDARSNRNGPLYPCFLIIGVISLEILPYQASCSSQIPWAAGSTLTFHIDWQYAFRVGTEMLIKNGLQLELE